MDAYWSCDYYHVVDRRPDYNFTDNDPSAIAQPGLYDHSTWLDQYVGNVNMVVIIIGFLSAVIDNVLLVAAAMGMYDLTQYPVDHSFWQFLAYSAGTGGSMLIIGSAAGVAAMGIEEINFFWYMKKVAWIAAIGFLAGAAIFILQEGFFT